MTQPQINTELQESNHNKILPYLQRLTNINLTILKGRLERGMYLSKIKVDKIYQGYDGWVHTWAEFLDNIGIARETARQDMEIYSEFASYVQANPKLAETLTYERLVRLLPVVKSNPDIKPAVVEMAATASRYDFENNVKELKGQTPDDKCVNPSDCTSPKIILERCQICGVTYRRKDLE
tara:strand:+ start:2314 stop:2853 length:540 start_codon:yes stop_codon:yes gene_type:complete